MTWEEIGISVKKTINTPWSVKKQTENNIDGRCYLQGYKYTIL